MSREAIWCQCECGCKAEAYIHHQDIHLCPFCYLSLLVALGYCESWRADRMEATLRVKRAEENLRLVEIVHGPIETKPERTEGL